MRTFRRRPGRRQVDDGRGRRQVDDGPGRRWRGDDGFATVVVLALAAVLTAAATLVATLGSVAVTRHEAMAAADLGALAGALHGREGRGAACAAAARTAGAQGARLEDCRVAGSGPSVVLTVTVSVAPAGALSAWGRVRASARAGPVP